MAYMVTGGTGFIGAWVVKAIRERGHEVVCFELAPNPETLRTVLGADADRVKIVTGDVLHLHTLIDTIRSQGVTHIAHIAAAVMRICHANPPYAMQVNVVGFANVLEAMRLTGIRRMAYASSGAVFGGGYGRELVANDARFAPDTIYGASKLMGEALALHYFRHFAVDAIGLRYTFVNGLGMPNSIGGKAIDELCTKPALGKPGVVPWGDDSPDWLWAGDAGRATALALDVMPTPTTRAFNIVGDYRPMAEAIAFVRSQLPGAQVTPEPGAMGFTRLDGAVAARELGYRPEWTMEKQLRAHIDRARPGAG
ncbi:MAG: NAD(P)-dependent oxidoreductase [Alphaproteobacteria bacterium]|nr:NAD(P)-dependent oxidoreductase [Alphaproteobacteria bacterium]